MAQIDPIGTAENTLVLGVIIAVGVALWYVWKGLSGAASSVGNAANAVGTGAGKVLDFINNPLGGTNPSSGMFPASQGNSNASKTVTDLGNVDENGTLTATNYNPDLAWILTGGAAGGLTPTTTTIATGVPPGYGGSIPPDETQAILDNITPMP